MNEVCYDFLRRILILSYKLFTAFILLLHNEFIFKIFLLKFKLSFWFGIFFEIFNFNSCSHFFNEEKKVNLWISNFTFSNYFQSSYHFLKISNVFLQTFTILRFFLLGSKVCKNFNRVCTFCFLFLNVFFFRNVTISSSFQQFSNDKHFFLLFILNLIYIRI